MGPLDTAIPCLAFMYTPKLLELFSAKGGVTAAHQELVDGTDTGPKCLCSEEERCDCEIPHRVHGESGQELISDYWNCRDHCS
nr:uncharacterized protein LOC133619168 isoform X4 [Nerophis lumbriciformis]